MIYAINAVDFSMTLPAWSRSPRLRTRTGQVTVFVGVGQVLVAEQTAYKLTGVANVGQ